MYQVESVELPQAKGKKGIYPFKTLQVGESFLIEASPEQMTKTQRKMSALCVMSGKRHGKKFVTRRVDNGVRIFRIEEVKS
jgi:hypothetical protein